MSGNVGGTVVGAQLWVEYAFSVQEENMKDGTQKKQQLVDEQISVEPRLPRRSFLAKTGAMLLGAAAVVSATRAAALTAGLQQAGTEPKKETDPDAKKETDPDSKKDTGKKTTTKTTSKAKASDPDAAPKSGKKKSAAAKDTKKTSGESDPDKPKQPPY